jgi:aspartyl-tRNA synthetase
MTRTWIGELGEGWVGRRVEIAGWVHRVRNHGGLLFFDLRDRSGLVQVVVRPEHPDFPDLQALRPEWVVALTGRVVARRPEFVNPRLTTGAVEIEPESVRVLNEAEPPPIRGADEGEMDELLRLRYRYLDLRRPAMRENIVARHRLAQAVRTFLNDEGFLEIETPMLTRSTPEGARDFLVPSRLARGNFYALPQSPQLFKQLFMVAGLERYYQIVRCFRDEDLRADRQPEFTQIDIEMSFVDREDVLDVAERMTAFAYRAAGGWEVATPFPRLTYEEAMARYGSDKPDLRYELPIHDLTDWAGASGPDFLKAAVARGEQVAGIVTPSQSLSRKEIEGLVDGIPGALRLLWAVREGEGFRGGLASALRGEAGEALAARLPVADGGLVALSHGPREALLPFLGHLRQRLAERLDLIPAGRHAFVWVTDFPLFEWSDEEGRLVAVHHPFTAPHDEDVPLLQTAPERVRAKAYDLVLDGYELGGGSIRIHRREVQEAVFEVLGLARAEAEQKFGFLLEAFRYGAPPHGGIAFGFDRMAMLLVGARNLREVIAFPKTASGADPLTGAPAPAEPRQLAELGIAVVSERRSG